ncbi:MAG: oligosaccharide flippase family protein [Clostridia bacterium]|nr:oligosaccharide flippase family protein [Clostridia bacterium]
MSEKVKRRFKLKKPASAGILYTALSAMERGSSVIFAPIYTRLLLPEEYGIYSLFISFMGIISIFSTLEISGGAVYRALREFEDEKRVSSAAIGLISITSLLTFLAYLLFSDFINSFSKLNTYLTVILFVQVFLNGIRAIKSSSAKFSYDKKLPLLEGIFFSFISPFLSITFLILFDKSEYSKIYASLLSSIAFSAPIIFTTLKQGAKRLFDKRVWIFLIKYSLPTVPHFLSMSLIWQIGKICVANSFSTAETALLSLAISVSLIPSVISTGIQSAMVPWLTRRLPEGSAGRKRIYSLLLTAFFPFCLLVVLFLLICPELFVLLSTKAYYPALIAVYPIALGVPLLFLSAIFSSEISHYKRTLFITFGSLSGMFFSLICNLLFTSKVGFLLPAILIPPAFFIINTVYVLFLRLKLHDIELPIAKLILIFFAFSILVLIAFLLRISFSARLVYAIALIMLMLPRLMDIKELCKE